MTKKEFIKRCKELIKRWKVSCYEFGRYGDYEEGKDSARDSCADDLKWLLDEYEDKNDNK